MSLSAAFRAIALGFEHAAAIVDAETTDTAAPAATPSKGRGKKPAAAPESAQPAATQPPAASAPAPQPAPSPAAPTLSKEKLNKAVLAVASKSRDEAVALLAKFGVANTATLPVEKYQEVFDAFEEKLAQLDAASVQASLV